MMNNFNSLRIISLFLGDYKKELHLREVSRLSELDIKIISIEMNKLIDENIFLFKVIGKNKCFYLNLNNIKTKKYLVLAENMKSFYFSLEHDFVNELLPNEFILFGSYAKEDYTQKSDIDIVLFADKKIKNNKFSIQRTTWDKFEKMIKQENVLALEIIKNHIIYGNVHKLVEILWRQYGGR